MTPSSQVSLPLQEALKELAVTSAHTEFSQASDAALSRASEILNAAKDNPTDEEVAEIVATGDTSAMATLATSCTPQQLRVLVAAVATAQHADPDAAYWMLFNPVITETERAELMQVVVRANSAAHAVSLARDFEDAPVNDLARAVLNDPDQNIDCAIEFAVAIAGVDDDIVAKLILFVLANGTKASAVTLSSRLPDRLLRVLNEAL